MNYTNHEQGSENRYSMIPNSSTDLPLDPTEERALQPLEDVISERNGLSWEAVVTSYLDAAVDSPNTRRAYRRHLKHAGLFFNGVSVAEVTGVQLAAYRAEVIASGLASASQAQRLAALRSFFGWVGDLGGHGMPARLVTVALKSPRTSVAVRYNLVSDKEIAALFDVVRDPRERAVLGVLLGSGLRVSEAAKLSLADIVEDLDGGVALLVREGKGQRNRVVPIGPEVDMVLREYLVSTSRYLGGDGPLFLAIDRGAARRPVGLSTRAVSRLVGEMAQRAGISAKRVSPHAFRHSYAIRCLRNGGNVVAVAKLLGHSSISTTQRYVDHLATSELRATVPPLPISME